MVETPNGALDFLARSTVLAVVMTGLPIGLLLVIWELGLTRPSIVLGWLLFTLFWTFYSILKLSARITSQ